MKNLIALIIILFVMSGCYNTGSKTIEEWQEDIKKNNPQLENIFLYNENGFYFSFNKKDDASYLFFYKNLNAHNIKESIETWLETHKNDKKVILNAGYSVNNGICFKQTESYNQLNFCYRIGGNMMKRYVFRFDKGSWKYIDCLLK